MTSPTRPGTAATVTSDNDPTYRSITWDGVDIRAADPAQLRNRLTAGGQCQRVALARAFLRDRDDLLILDVPSAVAPPSADCSPEPTRGRVAGGPAARPRL